MSSNELCKACTLLEGLERGVASAGIVSTGHVLHSRLFILDHMKQTDRARKRMDEQGPAPTNLRTIPYFHLSSARPS